MATLAETSVAADTIRIRGARTHNLKNVDLDIPLGKFVVITGPSGSGKSSLAFDTLFAEGQRQYIESLSVHARQFFDQLERPDADEISGLAPVVCIDQRQGAANPRSTVGTITEIYDFLRLLFARVGSVACPSCGEPVRQQSSEEIEDVLAALPEGMRLMLLAPLVRGRKGQHAEVFEQIRKAGLVRVRLDGEVMDLDSVPPLDGRKSHTIEAVVDRIVVREGSRSRLAESLQLALQHGEGVVVASHQSSAERDAPWTDQLFSTLYACPSCGTSLAEIEPRTFSFNSPYGACPACDGLGYRIEFDPELVIPDASCSISGGAIAPWRTKAAANDRKAKAKSQESGARRQKADIESFLASHGHSPDSPIAELPRAIQEKLFRGDGEKFAGLVTLLEQELATATNAARQEELQSFRGRVPCPACHGSRLRPEALSVFIAGQSIAQLCHQSISAARLFLSQLPQDPNSPSPIPSPPALPSDSWPIAQPILHELTTRLGFLEKVGLGYLSLDRASESLSGGELQRVRLASGIGSGLSGILYILDEPSIGLHPRDNQRLIDALRELQADNTVLVVEHDEAIMRQADWLVDIGPGAGSRGGEVVAQGTPDEILRHPVSLTGEYLAGKRQMPLPRERRRPVKSRAIEIEGVTTHNLKNVTASFPLGLFIGISGVSGSGKSSLINETLAPAIARKLGGSAPRPGPYEALRGIGAIDKLIQIDQSPLGRSVRSNAATYTGVFDEVRKVFAATKEAKQLGFKANRFSFNVAGGRCEECQGQGTKRLEMKFLPDLFVICPVCGGKRFNQQTLSVRYKGLSIADVLDMPIEEATAFFENFPVIHRVLASLGDVGLGYLSLGQQATTLSGGESQRIKLATELARTDTGQTLYLLDEPTTGLHFEDVRQLLGVLQRLVDRGNTVIVIEHHLDVLKCCDHLLDLGPEGGTGGGRIVATGTPEEVAQVTASLTGQFLANVL